MKATQANHPIWHTLHAAVIILAFGFAMWMNASNFDHTEISALLEASPLIGGSQYILYRHLKKQVSGSCAHPECPLKSG